MAQSKDTSEIIREDDLIYDIIVKHPEIKQALAALSPKFEKLNNPLLFQTVARHTTVKKASQIARFYINEMLLELNRAIGKEKEFLEYKKQDISRMKEAFLKERPPAPKAETGAKPEWFDKTNDFNTLDVRLEEGDPFGRIMDTAGPVKPGEGFVLIQWFEPLPVIQYLKGMGFESYTEEKNGNEFRVYFYKPAFGRPERGEGNERS